MDGKGVIVDGKGVIVDAAMALKNALNPAFMQRRHTKDCKIQHMIVTQKPT